MKNIKRIITALACIFILQNSSAKLVDTTYKATDVKPNFLAFNPQYAIINSMGIEFERLNSKQNIGHTLFFAFKNHSTKDNFINDISNESGIMLEYKLKYYTNGINTKKSSINEYNWGIYIAPVLQAGFWNLESTNSNNINGQQSSIVKTGPVTTIAPGFEIGLKKSLMKGLYIDVYMGGLVRYNKDENNVLGQSQFNVASMYHSGLVPKIGLSFGVNL